MTEAPSTLEEVLALPSVDFLGRDGLPAEPGLYFAVLDCERVAYIGKSSRSLRARWVYHHRAIDLLASGKPLLHYMTMEPGLALAEAEAAAIRALDPALNRTLRPQSWGFSPAPTTVDPVEGDRLLTIKQVAEHLKVTPMTVRRHIQAEHLAFERPGREYLIWESEVRRFDAERRKPGRPPSGPKPRRAPPA